MNMNQPPHPDDERLSALAAADDDARTDAALRAHVSACDRCRGVVDELTSLRTHLAAMPDLVPPRPIRIVLPPRDAAPAGFGQVVRRLFAPALAAGATLAIIGGVGLGANAMTFGSAASAPISAEAANEAQVDALAPSAAEESAEAAGADNGAGVVAAASDGSKSRQLVSEAPSTLRDDGSSEHEAATDGPPWLPLFIGGVALAGIALFLRFTVVPRAG
jgi:hypothetical protein